MEQQINEHTKPINDIEAYRIYLDEYKTGTLTANNPVYQLVKRSSLTICISKNCEAEADGVCQHCFLALAKGQYTGKNKAGKSCSLKTYVSTIIINEIRRRWKEKQNEVEIADTFVDEKAVVGEAYRRFCADKRLHQLIVKSPELRANVMKMIINFEENRAPRKSEIIRELNKNRPKKYSKYAIEKAIEQLRELCEREFIP